MGYDLHAADDREWEAYTPEAGYWRESIHHMGEFRAVVKTVGMLAPVSRPKTKPNDVVKGPIPLERLSSNDGWLVTATQCRMLRDRMLKMMSDRDSLRELVAAYGGAAPVDVEWETETIITLLSELGDDGARVVPPDLMVDDERVVAQLIEMMRFFSYCEKHGGFHVW